jgi:transcription elongation factor Elf1
LVHKEKMMARPVKTCPKCRVKTRMTVHHLLPLRFYKRKGNITFMLCWTCHKFLEERIPQTIKKPRDWYIKVLLDYLQEEPTDT